MELEQTEINKKKKKCHLGFDRFQLIFCLVVFVQRIVVLPLPAVFQSLSGTNLCYL